MHRPLAHHALPGAAMTQQSILTVPWVVLEDAQVHQVDADAPTVATPAANIEEDTNNGGRRWFRFFVALSAAWCVLAALLLLAGALAPVRGNAVTYVAGMAGLFCAAFLALTWPRPDGPETFHTFDVYPVGQCTPSRANTLTGRGSS